MTPTSTITTAPSLPFIQINNPFDGIVDFFYYIGGENIWEHIVLFWSIYSIIAILLSLLFFVGMVYAKIRYAELSDIESEEIHHAEQRWAARHAKPETHNARWDVIQQRVNDTSPESWRIAIIEADILLDETLTQAGYFGQSLGDKLRSANPQSFRTVQDAWDAHKVRNEIAHVGSDFVLTQRTAQETIVKFERVFREFGVI